MVGGRCTGTVGKASGGLSCGSGAGSQFLWWSALVFLLPSLSSAMFRCGTVVLDGGVGAGLFVVAVPLALARLDGSGSGNLREPFIVGGRSVDLPVFCWRRCWSFGYCILAFRVVVSVSRR